MTIPVSVYMLTRNNEATLRRALESVRFADDLVVVDSYSEDDTLAIAREFTDRVYQRQWPGFRDQYQFAADQCRHDWALFIDADEEVSEELAAEMVVELERQAALPPEARLAGYVVHRRTFYLDRWIQHGGWLPDREVRLYDRQRGRWLGDLHANIHLDGAAGELAGFYYHYTYGNISDQLQTVDRYSTTAAEDADRAGKRPSLLKMVFSPPARFLKDYILKQGFLDGVPGLVIAVNTMLYVFNKHAKLWERQRCLAERVERAKQQKPGA